MHIFIALLTVCDFTAGAGVGEGAGFFVTGTREYFYRKSLVLIADYERMCREAGQLSKKEQASLTIG